MVYQASQGLAVAGEHRQLNAWMVIDELVQDFEYPVTEIVYTIDDHESPARSRSRNCRGQILLGVGRMRGVGEKDAPGEAIAKALREDACKAGFSGASRTYESDRPRALCKALQDLVELPCAAHENGQNAL